MSRSKTPRGRRPVNFKEPYFVWRDGRPRWVPGRTLLDAGWQGRDLKGADGDFLPKGAAIDAAAAINKAVAEWRAAGASPQALPVIAQRAGFSTPSSTVASLRRDGVPNGSPPTTAAGRLTGGADNGADNGAEEAFPSDSLHALAQTYFASPRFDYVRRTGKPKSERTKEQYKSSFRLLPASFRACNPATIDRPALERLYETLQVRRGTAQANAMFRALSVIMSHGVRIGLITVNPVFRFDKQGLGARLRLILPAEAVALVEAADEIGLHHIADALFLGLHAGQRWADTVSLPPRIIDERHVRLTQAKTGAMLDAPMTPQLRARMKDWQARMKAASLIPSTIVCDAAGQSFAPTEEHPRGRHRDFNRDFIAVRRRAGEKVPSVAGIQMKDTRDTAVTRLALAGCQVHEISAISGHSLASIHQILKHYLVMTGEMAESAINKLVAYMEKEGIGV